MRALPKSPNLPLPFFRRRLLVIFSTFPSPKRNACPQSRAQNHPNLPKFSNVCCSQSNSFPHRSVRLYLFTKTAEIQITLLFVCFFTNQIFKQAAITKHRQYNIKLSVPSLRPIYTPVGKEVAKQMLATRTNHID